MTIQLNGAETAPDLRLAIFAPAPDQKSGGPYGWLTPYLAAITAANPGVAARILSLPRDELHFIAMALSLMGAARDDPMRLHDFARAIGRKKREIILAEAAPYIDSGLARFCGKLAGRPWRPSTYVRLSTLAAEPHARKTLGHLKAITRRAVLTLARLAPPYRTRGVLMMINRPAHLSRLLFAIEIVRRVRTDLSDRQILKSLERSNTRSLREWVEAHYERLPFPPSPAAVLTDGRGGVLRPVSSGAELRRTGVEFDNCVQDYQLKAFRGVSAFYRYERGDQRIAVVEIRKMPGVGWAIEEISGPGNRTIASCDRALIIKILAGAGITAAPSALSRYRWLDLGG